MNSGQLLVRGSVWPAIACGLAAILWNDRPRWTRRLWGAGLAFYLVHVAAAFGFIHGWSHRQALEFTRRETTELTGWNSGFGLYANYAFTLAWMGFVAVESMGSRKIPAQLNFAWQLAFLFMAVNGAIIFARPPARRVGIVMFAVFLIGWIWRHRTRLISGRNSHLSPRSMP
jgi:hypothetical protein